MAAAGSDWLEVSDLEVGREGPSYTAETLALLREQAPDDELTLILGADQAAHLASWREPERVLELARVAVAAREGMEREAVMRRLHDARSRRARSTSSRCRAWTSPRRWCASAWAEGRPVRYLVPEPVADAVAERGLYTTGVGAR